VAQGHWAEARGKDDFASFAPVLARVVALRQQEGQALANGGDTYDALLEDYEPGATAVQLEAMFAEMRPRLVELRGKVLEKPAPAGLSGTFGEAEQMAFTAKLALAFGYDLSRGRIDMAVHPFSSGSGSDVRITTRTSATDPFNCFYSTIHEVGHACYEQNIDAGYALTPLGGGVSMGVHESQSRIYENQLGRSRAFTGWMLEEMKTAFGDIGVADADAFYAAVNRVQKDFIRTESDELQYNLHIMLRFDLERALISGDLPVADLESAWNTRFKADFGYDVPKASLGCLQDVHWSLGLFGYFATYSLGNVYAGCLSNALRADVPDLDSALAAGNTAPATTWLRDKVQRHGGLYEPREVITQACGAAPTAAPLLDYIETKFSEIYGL
jgi:carboxypeptidase Taq